MPSGGCPGIFLASTKGDSGFAFSHSDESVAGRLSQIFWTEAPIQTILLAAGLAGPLAADPPLGRRPAGLSPDSARRGWPGATWRVPVSRWISSSRGGIPSRCIRDWRSPAAVGLEEAMRRLRVGPSAMGSSRSLGRWPGLFAVRAEGPGPVAGRIPSGIHLRAGEPFLSSRPSPRLALGRGSRPATSSSPGERLLYEEGGKDSARHPGPVPARAIQWAPALHRTGVEVIGGPYLHASLTTNFTQFGEGKLFGQEKWDRDFFVRYARLYRPSAILCWSPHARAFCRANPDLIRVARRRRDPADRPGRGIRRRRDPGTGPGRGCAGPAAGPRPCSRP